jgi:four helix bundle protein
MAKDFTELAAWQLSHELRQLMFAIVARPNASRDFKYCNQCKDAARSAASNIAEGFGRFSHKEFARFLDIAIGSLTEVQDLLYDGHARGHVSDDELANGVRLAKRAKAACAALAAYLRRTPDPPRGGG